MYTIIFLYYFWGKLENFSAYTFYTAQHTNTLFALVFIAFYKKLLAKNYTIHDNTGVRELVLIRRSAGLW